MYPLNTGDTTRVPSGTPVLDTSVWPNVWTPLKRAVTVRVGAFDVHGAWEAVRKKGSPAEFDLPADVLARYAEIDDHEERDAFRIDVAINHLADHLLVGWSNDTKWVPYKTALDCKVADPAPAQPPKERALSIKQMLVPKSVWRFTADLTITAKYRSYVGRQVVEELTIATVKAGDEFTVTGKMVLTFHNGSMFPALLDGQERSIPFDAVKGSIEPVGTPVVKVVLLRDKATGLYWAAENVIYDLERVSERKGPEAALKAVSWTDRIGAAKKFKNVGGLRTWLLGLAGYYEEIDRGTEEWNEPPTRKVFDIPGTWEIVEMDKLTKNDIGVFDIHGPLAQSFRLRSLTVTFGSSVRTLYKNLEKAGKLAEFQAVVVFRPDDDVLRRLWQISDLQPEIYESITSLGLKKADTRMVSGEDTIAVALPSLSHAMMLKLAYAGDLKIKLIDMVTMEEVIDGRP